MNYAKIKISKLLKNEKDALIYEYDFGDGWEHRIVLEKSLPEDQSSAYPGCIGGKNACPPEDCGGIWGYMEFKEIISDPSHEAHESMMEWLDDDFDPTAFDMEEVNKALQINNFGMFE